MKIETPVPGHRTLPHTADLRIEAWAPTRSECIEEAVQALTEAFADVPETPVTETLPISIGAASDDDVLLLLLEEVIYSAEVLGLVPASAELIDAEDGGLAGSIDAVPVQAVEIVGAVPKGVSHEALELREEDGRWSCRATVDV